jgi:cbb3-type cytochrome oxidase subunit 3
MSSERSAVATLGSSILLLAFGSWLLFVAGTAIVFRSDTAAYVGMGGDTVTTVAALLAVVGLATVFWAYRLGSSATRGRSMPR